jgi:hypothetical protein
MDLIIDKTKIEFLIETVLSLWNFRKAKVGPQKGKKIQGPKKTENSQISPNFTLFHRTLHFFPNIHDLSVKKFLTTFFLVISQFFIEESFLVKFSFLISENYPHFFIRFV